MKLIYIVLCLIVSLTSCSNMTFDEALQAGLKVSESLSVNSAETYSKAVKETLELSSSRATDSLSANGGYSASDLYKITMPESMTKIASALRTFGLDKQVDSIELLMNQGAEQAAIEAKSIFIKAVSDMSITDALGIIRGSNTAATDYFKANTQVQLRSTYLPIIQSNLNKVGFYSQYKQFLSLYNSLPINKPNLDLEQHALDKSLDALFSQVAMEEAAIRQDPVGKGTAFLSSIFK